MKLTLSFLLVAIAVVFFTPSALPQTNLTMQAVGGVVRNPNRVPVSGAIVRVENSAATTRAQTSTEEDCKFSLRVSIATTLSLRITTSGFHASLLPLPNGSRIH